MRGWRIAAALAVLAIGCKTKEMKSTPFYEGDDSAYVGRAENRVNLWPLAYWREPACSVAWPLVSFSDDHFALRPVYSQYRQDGRNAPYDEYNVLWPFGQADLKSGDYTAFPFFWSWDKDYFAMFPLVLMKTDTTVFFPLMMNGSGSEGCLFPLVWWTHERGKRSFTLFPVYSYSWTPERTCRWGACGLFGNYRTGTGEYAHWIQPFYYANRSGLYSIPWTRTESFDGGDVVDAYLCGLGGRAVSNGVYRSSWVAPLFYHDMERLLTPLFGKSSGSDWVMPLYYRDEHSFFTLACAGWRNPDTGSGGFVAPPLLTWATWSTNSCRSSWGTLAGLVGAKSNATGERRKSWAAPFFHSDAGRSFHSLLYGWTGGGTPQTNTWWATPLVGTRAGRDAGWWAFPLYGSHKSADYDRISLLADEPTLSADVDVDVRLDAWDDWKILLSGRICGVVGSKGYGGQTNRYVVSETHGAGNPLLYWQTLKRRAVYDIESRAKTSDRETNDASLLWFLYDCSSERDLMSGSDASRHQVLWKLWDWRRSGGDVRLDAFPGFAYDSHSDGYVKLSLAWRLFRYESAPAGETKADLLFVPIWR